MSASTTRAPSTGAIGGSPVRDSLTRRFLARTESKVGLILTGAVLLVAILGPFLAAALTGHTTTEFVGRPFVADGAALGTDNLGRDVLSRWLAGGWRLLLWSAAATALGVGLGAVLGMVAAMRGGWLDALIMRIGDIGLALPQLVFAMLAVTVLGPEGWVLILVVGLTHAPRTARVMRSAAVGVVGEDYVLASHMYAVPQWRILLQDILPNVTGPLMVELGLRMTYSIGALASLSFLGLGMQPPTADWGLMINENRIALAVQPWGVLLPVLAIAVLTVGTNLIADGVAAASAGGSSVVEEDLEGVRAGAQGAVPAGSPAVPESEAATGSASAAAPEAAAGPDTASSPEEGRR